MMANLKKETGTQTEKKTAAKKAPAKKAPAKKAPAKTATKKPVAKAEVVSPKTILKQFDVLIGEIAEYEAARRAEHKHVNFYTRHRRQLEFLKARFDKFSGR